MDLSISLLSHAHFFKVQWDFRGNVLVILGEDSWGIHLAGNARSRAHQLFLAKKNKNHPNFNLLI